MVVQLLSGNDVDVFPESGIVRKRFRSRSHCRHEVRALELVSRLAPAVPRVRKKDPRTSWVELDYFTGSSPDISDPSTSTCIGAKLGAIASNIHTSTRGRVKRLRRRTLKTLLRSLHGLGDSVPSRQLQQFLLDHQMAIFPSRECSCLIHRDLSARNLIYNPDSGSLHLIDFETACAGPFQADLARLLFFERSCAEFRTSFVDAYGVTASCIDEVERIHVPVFAIEFLEWLQSRPEAQPENDANIAKLYACLHSI